MAEDGGKQKVSDLVKLLEKNVNLQTKSPRTAVKSQANANAGVSTDFIRSLVRRNTFNIKAQSKNVPPAAPSPAKPFSYLNHGSRKSTNDGSPASKKCSGEHVFKKPVPPPRPPHLATKNRPSLNNNLFTPLAPIQIDKTKDRHWNGPNHTAPVDNPPVQSTAYAHPEANCGRNRRPIRRRNTWHCRNALEKRPYRLLSANAMDGSVIDSHRAQLSIHNQLLHEELKRAQSATYDRRLGDDCLRMVGGGGERFDPAGGPPSTSLALTAGDERRLSLAAASFDRRVLRVQSAASTISRSSSRCSAESIESDASTSTSASSARPVDKLYCAAREIFTSERQYVGVLEALSVTLPAFVDAELKRLHRSSEPVSFCKTLTVSLSPLLILHRNLLELLEKTMNEWKPEGPNVSKAFLSVSPFIKMSVQFLRQKSTICQEISDHCRKNAEFKAIIHDFETQFFNGLLIIHQLDCIHQRVCRYPLLIASYLKYLDPDCEEHENATRSKSLLESIVRNIEQGLTEDDDTRRILELQRRIVGGKMEILSPGRRFVKEGEILKHSRKEVQNRVLLLFSDVLLYCAYVLGTSNLNVRYAFDLLKLRLSMPKNAASDDEELSLYSFHLIGKSRSIIVVTRTHQEFLQWTTVIRKSINELKCRRESDAGLAMNGADRLSLYGSACPDQSSICTIQSFSPVKNDLSDLGKIAPVWIPDNIVTMCQNCRVAFTRFRRRHHCRACGKVICSDCCGEAPLEYADFAVKIVCPRCYNVLSSTATNNNFEESNSGLKLMRMGDNNMSYLVKLKAPKNRAFESDCADFEDVDHVRPITQNQIEDQMCTNGYLYLYEGKSGFVRYWTVLKLSGVLELYSACGDPVCKKSIVLLSYHLEGNQRMMPPESDPSVFFDLVHLNQIAIPGKGGKNTEIRYCFKADNEKLASKWLDAISNVKNAFE